MPSIIIREVETSRVPSAETTTNAVFIPGYATKGPRNIPVYCETVADFEKIFGEKPYEFESDQIYPEYIVNSDYTVKFSTAAKPNENFANEGDKEKSYIYAKELLNQGIPVWYVRVFKEIVGGSPVFNINFGNEDGKDYIEKDEQDQEPSEQAEGGEENPHVFNVIDIYDYLDRPKSEEGEYSTIWEMLLDKSEYVLKYISTGAYPVFEYNSNSIAKKLINTCASRGDCIALLDHTDNIERPLLANNTNSVYASVKSFVEEGLGDTDEDPFGYTAMFTPYATYECDTIRDDNNRRVKQVLPASFGYLYALALSVKNNENWLAVAGSQRGKLQNIVGLRQTITNAIAESYQSRAAVSINPITKINPYGYLIWGNRTLKDNAVAGELKATSFLNIRQLVSDVKRVVYVAAKKLTFEQVDDRLWVNFKAEITPLLDRMVAGSGLIDYKLERKHTDKKATVVAKITLYCIEAVEDWDITIELSDSDTTIAE